MDRYRPNVAAILMNSRGKILVCERFKTPNSWQFPQGGVDVEEKLVVALKREVKEEVGIGAEAYEVKKVKGGYRYDYPKQVRSSQRGSKKNFRGQEQTYFLCQTKDDYPEVNLMREPREFAQAKWIYPEEFQASWLPDFKKDVYRSVIRDFFEAELLEE